MPHELATQQIDAVTAPGSDAVKPGRPGRSVSVFVAAYNEAENLEPTVDTIVRALDGAVEDFEIIVVNDGSTDGTDKVADRLAAESSHVVVLHNPGNRGLGYGWMRAIEAARMGSFVFIPGDNTWPYPSLRDLFGAMGRADVITSYPTNSEIRDPARRLLSTTYTMGLNLLFGLNLRYFHGLTIYPTEFLRSNVITTYGFASMAEALLRAIHHGYSYVAVPCAIEERATGRSNAVNAHNLRSVVDTISRLFFELRLRSRRGRTSTLGLLRPSRGATRGSPAGQAASPPATRTCGDV